MWRFSSDELSQPATRKAGLVFRIAKLDIADYTIAGTNVFIERKTHSDLYRSLTHERKRFEAEVRRAIDASAQLFVVCECEFKDILTPPKEAVKAKHLPITRTIQSWSVRYGIQFVFPGPMARLWSLRLMEFAWIASQRKPR